jgi:hypothetical protein
MYRPEILVKSHKRPKHRGRLAQSTVRQKIEQGAEKTRPFEASTDRLPHRHLPILPKGVISPGSCPAFFPGDSPR